MNKFTPDVFLKKLAHVVRLCMFAAFSLLIVSGATAQNISITSSALTYTQNFNSFDASGTAPTGWSYSGSFKGQGCGSSSTGGVYSFGSGSDWSLGFLPSTSASSFTATVNFQNNTGSAITALTISYNFENWRRESRTNGFTVTSNAGNVSALSETAPTNSLASCSVITTPKTVTLTGLNIANGATFYITWSGDRGGGAGSSQAVSIDDFSLTATIAPACTAAAGTINSSAGNTFCGTANTMLSLSGATSSGVTYQWKQSANGVTYTNVGSSATSLATGVISATTYYKCVVSCTSGTSKDSTAPYVITVKPTYNNTATANICAGQSYTFGTQTLTTAGNYTAHFTAANGCDSAVTLTLTVNPTYNNAASAGICNGQTYSWGGQSLTTAGTYTHLFTSSKGCDSNVTLTLTINPSYNNTATATICEGQTYTWGGQSLTTAGTYTHLFTSANGCDSNVTLTLTVNPAYNNTASATICNGQTYTWGGQNYTTAGTYTHLFTTINGCDSNVTLTLTVNPTYNNIASATICNGQTYTWGGQNYTTAGTYTHLFTTINGCDSNVTLTLTVNPTYNNTASATICNGQTYTWGGQNYTTAGTYTHLFTTVNGCDSNVTLTLTVNPTYNNTASATICNGQTYTWGGQSYTTAGTYTHLFTTVNGCDSNVTLTLTVNPTYNNTANATICNGQTYAWGGQNYTTAGTYTHLFTSSRGCDSNVTLTLTVNPTYNNTASAAICNGQTYTWGGQNYTTAGTYTHLFTSSRGCDSNVTLTLIVNPTYNNTATVTMCAGGSYSWGGQTLTLAGTYTHLFTTVNGCDSNVTLTLIVYPGYTIAASATICNGQTYAWGGQNLTTAGIYTHLFTSGHGCDSNVSLILSVNPSYNNTATAAICAGHSYSWGGQTLTTAGAYTHLFTSAQGCDSNVTLTLTVHPVQNISAAAAICAGQSYTWGGQTLTTAGIYTHLFASSQGCDSNVTLTLTVNPGYNTTASAVICAGETFNFGGTMLSLAGTYTNHFSAMSGCDSLVTLTLTVNPTYNNAVSASICAGQIYNFGGTNLNVSGVYTHHFATVNGCDSMVTLTLTVNPNYNNTASATICADQTYSFGGTNLNTSGVYTRHFTSVSGCDSTVVLTLTVNPVYNNTMNAMICAGQTYSFGGTVLSASGIYTHHFTSVKGCDSMVVLALTVNPTYNHTAGVTICSGQSYDFGGTNLAAAGTYVHHFTSVSGCDSAVTLTLTVNPVYNQTVGAIVCTNNLPYHFGTQMLTATGVYTEIFHTVYGCDSVVTLNLTVQPAPVVTVTPSGPAQICSGSSMTLTAQTSQTTLEWYKNTQPDPAFTGNTYTVTEAGNYFASTTINGCVVMSNTVTVTEVAPPSVMIAPDGPTRVCSGQEVPMSVTTTGANVVWKRGSQVVANNTPIYIAHQSGTYSVTVSNGICNVNSNEIEVEILPLPVAQILRDGPVSFCEGGSVTFYLPQDIGDSYIWYKDNVALPATDTFYKATEAGVYKLEVTVATCSTASASIPVTVYPLPQPVITANGHILSVQPSFSSYQWYLDGAPVTSANGQTYTAQAIGNYTVSVQDVNGCSNTSAEYPVVDLNVPGGLMSSLVKVYPNPAVSRIYIEAPVKVNVIMTGIDGQLITMQHGVQELDVSAYPAGIYMLKITDDQGTVIRVEKITRL